MKTTHKGSFSAELQKYYVRRGNKIIFTNGMTLNQLAWEMWERLGYKEIDPSVVSRVLVGERVFTSKQLRVFSTLLRLSEKQKKLLEEIYLDDIARCYGFENILINRLGAQFIEYINDINDKIAQAKSQSFPTFIVRDWISLAKEKVKDQVSKHTESAYMKQLMTVKGKLLIHELDIQLATEPLEKMENRVLANTYELKKIGTDFKISNFIAQSYSLQGNMLDIVSKTEKGAKDVDNGIDIGLSGWANIASNRASALIHATLNNVNEFNFRKKKLIRIAIEFPEQADYIYEGLARAESRLGNFKEAEGAIEKAWISHDYNRNSQYKEFPSLDLKRIEIVRTEAEVTANSKGKRKTPRYVNFKETTKLATKLGYSRMVQDINRFLS